MSLRILSGKYKNRKIFFGKYESIKPTLVRVRKIIFDTLIYKLSENFSFLDLFAGSGIMGIEALSRGAGKVIFLDLNGKALKGIENNLKQMDKIEGTFHIIKSNALSLPTGSPMDVIFIDPPYEKYYLIEDVIKKLIKYNWIKKETHIIIESKKSFTPKLNEEFFLYKFKEISNTRVFFYTYQIDISRKKLII